MEIGRCWVYAPDLTREGNWLSNTIDHEGPDSPEPLAPFRPEPPAPPRRTGSATGIRFRILGSLEVASDGELADLGPPKQRTVLAVLLLHPNEIVPTDQLVELVWNDGPPRTAAHSIQIYMSELRKVLDPMAGEPVILTRPPGYALQADPDSIDAGRFERLVDEGTRAIAAGDPHRGEVAIREALGLWRGTPLADFAYEEFAQPEIRRLQELRLQAVESLAAARLAAGSDHEVLPLVEMVIHQDPLRERSREYQMLAMYRTGRHAEALRSFQQFRELLSEELGLDPSPSLRQLQERILLHDPSLGPPAPSESTSARPPARNPYKGLRPFGEEDVGDFFGREALVARLLEALQAGSSLVSVVGPSGSGKSSVVNAGLVPALRAGALPGSERWLIIRMAPGEHPLDGLERVLSEAVADPASSVGRLEERHSTLREAAARLAPPRGRLAIVIDQFEELFSVADERARTSFLRSLTTAVSDPQGQVVVILTLRADFYDRPLLYPEFAAAFALGVVNVFPMTAGELEAAIGGPARRVGVEVDPALLAELVAAMVDQPGALPLLQYALTELFDRRSDGVLTLEEYRSLGGLPGALSHRADQLYERLDESRRRMAMQVFLRLARLGEGTKHSRRRASVRELMDLDFDPVALSAVLEEFGRHRLLSFDRDPTTGDATVEVAHEALLWEWERLGGWIERHRGDIRRHDAFTRAVEDWESSGRDPDYLFTGNRLAEFEAWSRDSTLRLTTGERAFLDAALDRRRAAQEQERARLEGQVRLHRRARTRLVALAASLELALVWTGYEDAGYDDMIEAGFDRGAEAFGPDIVKLSPDELQVEVTLRRLAEEGVPLIVVGGGVTVAEEVDAVAEDYPETRFITFDYPGERPNVSYLTFKDAEGSFLVGAAAALKSKTGVLGFIGGVDAESIWRFKAGYESGARAVDPDIEVRSVYLTEPPDWGFGSPTLGAQAADRLYDKGADVIYHAAGFSGIGLFEVARDRSREEGKQLWAIGVDVDQYRALPVLEDLFGEPGLGTTQPYVLTSMVKRVDRALYAALQDYGKGVFTGGEREFDLASGGVDIAYSGGFIDDIRPQIEALRARIISGEIEVPDVPADKTGAPTGG
jgi:basic membrane lipoprotein Med (substrate-binding protein (PBP1-ABC) superfamily)/DNA-binding SARP family transcriptional activator